MKQETKTFTEMGHLTKKKEELKEFGNELLNRDVQSLIEQYHLSTDEDYFEILDSVIREHVGLEDVDELDVNELVNNILFELDDKIQRYWGYE